MLLTVDVNVHGELRAVAQEAKSGKSVTATVKAA